MNGELAVKMFVDHYLSFCSQSLLSYLAFNLFNYSLPDEVYSRKAFQIRNVHLYGPNLLKQLFLLKTHLSGMIICSPLKFALNYVITLFVVIQI